jgi:hypothetical protein
MSAYCISTLALVVVFVTAGSRTEIVLQYLHCLPALCSTTTRKRFTFTWYVAVAAVPCCCVTILFVARQLSMYESRNKFDEANALYQVAVKKYSTSKKVRGRCGVLEVVCVG